MKLVVLRGRVPSRGQEACDTEIRRLADANGWELVRRSYDSAGSKLGEDALSARRSQQLYEFVHLQHTSVVSFVDGAATIRRSKLLPLGRFLRYKAFYQIAADLDRVHRAVSAISAAAADVNRCCDSARDPRVLPLHLFVPKEDLQSLDRAVARKAFQDLYWHRGSYRDPDRRPWVVPHADEMHGRQRLWVNRFQLARGFHWDVQSPFRSTGIRTPTGDFKLPKYGHANVLPDGRVVGPAALIRMGRNANGSSDLPEDPF